jgi:hypothetical protein
VSLPILTTVANFGTVRSVLEAYFNHFKDAVLKTGGTGIP